MEWTDETIGRLRHFWTEGLSTAEIGRRMGVSKNAVVGKAHRLLLSPRPSPIRREPGADAGGRPPALRRVVGPTLPSMASPAGPVRPGPLRSPQPTDQAASTDRLQELKQPRPFGLALRPEGSERRRSHSCCWPIGEPGTRSFRFCDANSLSGKPYCESHAALAYVRIRDRREDAA